MRANVRSRGKHLMIVGGGFAGMKAAQILERTLPSGWILTLIDQVNSGVAKDGQACRGAQINGD
jgi:NADH dehydrogenase FAD-containing subunit